MKYLISAACIALVAASPAVAQDSGEWDWKIAPYLWGVNIDGSMTVGPIDQDIDASFSDIFSNMDVGGSIYAELGKGQHTFHLDYTYLRLKPDPTLLPSPPFAPGSELQSKLTTKILELGYNYHLNETWSMVLGARYIDMAMRMTPTFTGPAPIDPEPLVAGPSWWDGFVGVKTFSQISTNWDFEFYGTIGAGGSDLPWTLQANFARRFSNDNRLMLGFRLWGLDYSTGEPNQRGYAALDARLTGFVVGYEFN